MEEKNLGRLRIEESRRTGKGGGKKIWIAAAGAVVLAVAFLAGKAAFKKTEVDVTKAFTSKGDGSVTVLNASGYVTPRRKATVAAKITGRVREILVDEGTRVREGDMIAVLDESDARAGLDRAVKAQKVQESALGGVLAKLEEAEANLERGKELLEGGILDRQSYDGLVAGYLSVKAQAESQKKTIDEARAAVRVADRELVNCEVRAPFDGIVISKDAQPGEMVSPFSAGGGYTRTGIATVVDMTSLEVEVDVSESNLARVREGQKVTATLDAYPDLKMPARVRTVIPSADRQKATVKVRITFDSLDPRVLPDMGVRVEFLKDAGSGGGVYVSRGAVRQRDGKAYAYFVAGGKAERREIELGEEAGDAVEVVRGMKDGDTVVMNPSEELRESQSVKIRNRA